MILPEAEARQTLKLMEHSPDDALTTTLASEVCQRNNSQAVLSGLIARFRQKYLITLDATDCATGKSLVESKIEAAGRDGVPQALDRIAADIRERLGESMASIRQFDVPLFPERTGSLDALRSYSVGPRWRIKVSCMRRFRSSSKPGSCALRSVSGSGLPSPRAITRALPGILMKPPATTSSGHRPIRSTRFPGNNWRTPKTTSLNIRRLLMRRNTALL
jgi:hypothetical protein